MSALPPEIDASDAMLAEAAKSDLVLMRHVQSLALAADDAAEVGTLVHAYARVSRAMRQNLALLAKQKADRAKAAREAAHHEAWLAKRASERTPEEMAYEERAEELQQAVSRVISAASAGDRVRHTELAHRFDRELDDWYDTDDFLDETLGAQVLRACRTLGLPADLAYRWRNLPDPTFFPDPAPEPDEVPIDAGSWDDVDPPNPDRPPPDPDAPPVPWANSG